MGGGWGGGGVKLRVFGSFQKVELRHVAEKFHPCKAHSYILTQSVTSTRFVD